MNRIIRFLSSLKIAITVIALIVVLAILATLIPQGREASFYTDSYGSGLGNLITAVQFDNFWRSALFLIPLAVFFVNLSACTLRRLIGRIGRKAPLRIGPDLIHFSLLMLIIAGGITLFTRQETVVFLSEGNSFELPDGKEIRLINFDIEIYEDGRPKDWISQVEVLDKNTIVKTSSIEVNKPLRMGHFSIFQSSYRNDVIAVLEHDDEKLMIRPGEAIPYKDGFIGFLEYRSVSERTGAVFIQEKDGKRTQVFLTAGEKLSGVLLSDLLIYSESGLQVVTQRGVFLIYISLFILCVGLFLSFYQKLGDMN